MSLSQQQPLAYMLLMISRLPSRSRQTVARYCLPFTVWRSSVSGFSRRWPRTPLNRSTHPETVCRQFLVDLVGSVEATLLLEQCWISAVIQAFSATCFTGAFCRSRQA